MEYLSITENRREIVTKEWFGPTLLPTGYNKYFTVEFDPGTQGWAIEAKAYVGIVPLTPEYGIQIRPKSGLKNLTYMLYKSGLLNRSLETPFDQTVPYQIPEDDLESFIEGLVKSFLQAVDTIKAWGLIREPALERRGEFAIRGKIDYPKWIRTLPHTMGIPVPQKIWTSHLNNLPNRTLRYCLDYLVSYSAGASIDGSLRDEVLGRLDYFGRVSPVPPTNEELSDLEHQMEAGHFPASRYYYLPALNLALLILRGAGLALGDEEDVTFKPILIYTADMFEKYVRVICQEAVKDRDAHAEDGKTQPLPFYKRASTPITVKPDILIRRGGKTALVTDVKYKFGPTEQDHYQMWAYMHAYEVKRGGFVSLADMAARQVNLPRWFHRNDYSVFDFPFNCQQITESERELKQFMAAQLVSALL
jgi:5-methylcytosine-specific restriction endonuclease McrBC regulatory subunit McrC